MKPPNVLLYEWCSTHGHVCEECTGDCPIKTFRYTLEGLAPRVHLPPAKRAKKRAR